MLYKNFTLDKRQRITGGKNFMTSSSFTDDTSTDVDYTALLDQDGESSSQSGPEDKRKSRSTMSSANSSAGGPEKKSSRPSTAGYTRVHSTPDLNRDTTPYSPSESPGSSAASSAEGPEVDPKTGQIKNPQLLKKFQKQMVGSGNVVIPVVLPMPTDGSQVSVKVTIQKTPPASAKKPPSEVPHLSLNVAPESRQAAEASETVTSPTEALPRTTTFDGCISPDGVIPDSPTGVDDEKMSINNPSEKKKEESCCPAALVPLRDFLNKLLEVFNKITHLNTFTKFAHDHPYATIIGIISSLSFAAYALCAASNSSPEKILGDWNKLDIDTQILSAVEGLSSLIINTYITSKGVANVQSELGKMFDGFKKSPHTIPGGALAFLLALLSTAASGALSYDGALWASPYGAGVIALFSLFPTFVTRFSGGAARATKILERILCKSCDSEPSEKAEFISELKKLSDEAIQEINKKLEGTQKLDKDIVEKLLKDLAETLFNQTSVKNGSKESLKAWIPYIFDIFLAGFLAVMVLGIFAQKGYDSQVLCGLDKNPDNTSVFNKAVSYFIGAISALFYFMTISDTREALVNAFEHVKKKPADIPNLMGWMTLNFFASPSMWNVTDLALKKDFPLTPFLKDFKEFLLYANRVSGGCVNGTIVLKGEFGKPTENPNFHDFLLYCQQNTIPADLVKKSLHNLHFKPAPDPAVKDKQPVPRSEPSEASKTGLSKMPRSKSAV